MRRLLLQIYEYIYICVLPTYSFTVMISLSFSIASMCDVVYCANQSHLYTSNCLRNNLKRNPMVTLQFDFVRMISPTLNLQSNARSPHRSLESCNISPNNSTKSKSKPIFSSLPRRHCGQETRRTFAQACCSRVSLSTTKSVHFCHRSVTTLYLFPSFASRRQLKSNTNLFFPTTFKSFSNRSSSNLPS